MKGNQMGAGFGLLEKDIGHGGAFPGGIKGRVLFGLELNLVS